MQDLGLFVLLGLPMLLISQFKDAIQFLSLQYRSDVEELGIGHNKDYILTEEQFNILEEFTT